MDVAAADEGLKKFMYSRMLARSVVNVLNAELVEDVLGWLHALFVAHMMSIKVYKTMFTCYTLFVRIFVIYYRIRVYNKSFPDIGKYFPLLSSNKMKRFKIRFGHKSNEGFGELVLSVCTGDLRNH